MIRIPTLAAALAVLAFASLARSDTPARAPVVVPSDRPPDPDRPVIDPGMNPSPTTILRNEYAALLDPPGRKMPADAAQLDAMLAAGQYAALYARLTGPRTPDEILLDINWEQAGIFNGASVLVTFAAVDDELRYVPFAPPDKQAPAQQTAMVFGLYALAQLKVGASVCGSPFVSERRLQELDQQFAAMWKAGRALPAAQRAQLAQFALNTEAVTRPVRQHDVVICSWGPTKDAEPPASAGIGSDLPADGASYPFGASDSMGNPERDPYTHLAAEVLGQISPPTGAPQ
ncbi:MAG TPA: hypothetical protein VGG29_03790 [Caulobacteraceae bacterium]